MLDALKGFIPVFISLHFYGQTIITLITAAVVVLGHTYTVFLGFKGGKGVATGAGVFLALAPIEIGIGLVVFIIVFCYKNGICWLYFRLSYTAYCSVCHK